MIDSNLGRRQRSRGSRGARAPNTDAGGAAGSCCAARSSASAARTAGASSTASCRRIEKKGVRSLSPDELQRLPILYRSAVSSAVGGAEHRARPQPADLS